MADKKYLDYAGLKRVLAKLLPGARKIWHGTIDEWDALSATEKDKYFNLFSIGGEMEMAPRGIEALTHSSNSSFT